MNPVIEVTWNRIRPDEATLRQEAAMAKLVEHLSVPPEQYPVDKDKKNERPTP